MTLLTLNLSPTTKDPVYMMLSQQVVNILRRDLRIILKRSILTVNNLLIFKGVYDYCFYNDSFIASGDKKKFHSQTSILRNLADNGKFDPESEKDFNGATCVYFDGLYEYFNAHVK